MGIKVTIPNTSSDTLTFGSANTTTAAQIAGIDSGSTNGQMAFYTTASGTSTERMRIDSSGNVGIGTSSPLGRLHVSTPGLSTIYISDSAEATDQKNWAFQYGTGVGAGTFRLRAINDANSTGQNAYIITRTGVAVDTHQWSTGGTERMRIDSSGNLLVGTTSNTNAARIKLAWATGNYGIESVASANTLSYHVVFANASNPAAGYISTTNNTTAYVTSSDYRLKENIAPMTGALATVSQLKPVTYTWKDGGFAGQGFIAHELQAVVPEAVIGEKDAVKEDGNPVYQGIDTSFLVATLTAAIQEQQAIIITMREELDALKAKVGA